MPEKKSINNNHLIVTDSTTTRTTFICLLVVTVLFQGEAATRVSVEMVKFSRQRYSVTMEFFWLFFYRFGVTRAKKRLTKLY